MSFSKISAISGAIALASTVAAHGTVTGIVADGVYYGGYSASFQYLATQPKVVGWSTPKDQSNGFIAPSAYTTPDIICHLDATNAQASATVAAGGTVDLQWTVWPESHHGPVIDYLANCNGDCSTVDKTALEFFKIDGVGLVDDTTTPGKWATDTMIANNNTWTVKVPSDIAPGKYVLRHEIIALHSAGQADGAQNYPQCFNLEVTGSGTAAPSGTLGTALYTPTDKGILVDIYSAIASYVVPGPALYSGAESVSQTAGASATSGAAVSATSSAATTSIDSGSTSSVTPVAAIAPFSNSTATASKKSKSACKSKSTLGPVYSSIAQQGKVPTSTVATTESFAATVTIPTSSAAPTPAPGSSGSDAETTSETIPSTTASPPSASETSSSDDAMPEGTTLSKLLSWVSSFYSSHKDSEYTGNTVARRAHARDVARQEMEKFDGVRAAASATHGGFPEGSGFPHHHHHHSGSAKPTGIFRRQEFPQGTGAPFPPFPQGTDAPFPPFPQGTGAPFPPGAGAPHHHHSGSAKPTGIFRRQEMPQGTGASFPSFPQGTGAPFPPFPQGPDASHHGHHSHSHGSGLPGAAKPTGIFRRQEESQPTGFPAGFPTGFPFPQGTGAPFPQGTGAPQHGHHGHGQGSGVPGAAKPTGIFGRQEQPQGTGLPFPTGTGFPFPQGTDTPHHGHPHGTGAPGAAQPTGGFPGFAFPPSGKFRNFVG